MATLTQLKDQVRILVGSPSTTELPDATLESLLTVEALEWLNRRRPNKTLSSFTTVDDQQDYDVKPTGAYRVTDVFWLSGDYEFFTGAAQRYYQYTLGHVDNLDGFSVVHNPALVDIIYKNVEQYKQNFEGTGKETEAGWVRLEPSPGGSGETVYFFYTHARWALVTEVGAEFVEGLKKIAAVKCLDFLFLKRGLVRAGRQFTGGGGANEDIVRKRYQDEAESAVPSIVNPFHHG